MDKSKISKLITSSNIEVVTLASAASKTERERLIRKFTIKTNQFQEGEIILVMIRPK